jgi:hypothetical protein
MSQQRNMFCNGAKVLLAPAGPGAGRIIVWWEVRRIAFNLVLLPMGLVGLLLLLMQSNPSPNLGAENDFVPFLSGLAALVVANICYTSGWIVNVIAWLVWGQRATRLGPVLWLLGTVLSILGSFAPAFVEWSTHRVY